MNYIKEINAFYYQLELNPLSSSAVSLWHACLHMNNKAGWKETFTVAVSVLRAKSGLKDSSFQRAREELSQKGYLSFSSRPGNQAAVYQLHSLSSIMEYTPDGKGKDSPDTLVKQNETKEKQKNNPTEAAAFYKENFGSLSPYLSEELTEWSTRAGEELVLEAMKRAIERNKTNWGYVKSILQTWAGKGILSLADAEAEETAFRQQKQKRSFSNTPKNQEVIPSWFKERQLKSEAAASVIREEPAGDEADIRQMIAEYLGTA